VLTAIGEIYDLINEYHMAQENTTLEQFAQADEVDALFGRMYDPWIILLHPAST
jgi:hypothetical protein